MARIDILAKRLEAEINSIIAQRLGKIDNPTIRKAIEETLRDQVYDNLGDVVSGQIAKVVDDSMQEIIASIQGTPAKKKAAQLSKARYDFGGKDDDSGAKDSGAKPSNRNVPPPSRFGGKDNPGYGGK